MAAEDGLLADLAAVVGNGVVLTDHTARTLYRRDASTLEGGVPAAVCLPTTTGEVAAVVAVCARHDRPFVTRGSGTGLAGGAVPSDGAVVIATTRMTDVVSVDATSRVAWVQPGVLNLDLTRHVSTLGMHFAPDPSSQQACTIGGNVANNSGGPHCLAAGVTTAHVVALDLVLPDATTVRLGGTDPEPAGLDLRGVVVGSEGTLGVVTAVAVRLTADPPVVSTLLASFDDLDRAAAAVSTVIAAGIVPAALEMIDGPLAAVVEDYVGAGLPVDAAAVLLVELDGSPAGVEAETAAVAGLLRESGAAEVSVAADEAQRELWWKARKSAFGAVARIAPDYYLHDTVVPRSQLPRVLAEIRGIAADHSLAVYNVFHAGDGNLHPLLCFDSRRPGVMDRVRSAGAAIVKVSLDAGGVLSGEHGIGLEKRDHMSEMFTPTDLEAQEWVRDAFDPSRRCNPDKVLPEGVGCGELGDLADGVWV